MKIGIISDTHDQLPLIESAVDIFNSEGTELVIHCGDWISPFTLIPFKRLNCKVRAVFGNNDGDRIRHLWKAKSLGLEIEYEDRFLEMEVSGRKLAVIHGDYFKLVEALTLSGQYDAVFYGHNHKPVIEQIGETLRVNPGAFINADDTAHRPTVAIYESQENEARHIFLS
jgi:hypothetical protein